MWKLQTRRGAALHLTLNNSIFKFRLEDNFLLRLMKTLCYFALNHCAEKPLEMWINQVYRSEKAIPTWSYWCIKDYPGQ